MGCHRAAAARFGGDALRRTVRLAAGLALCFAPSGCVISARSVKSEILVSEQSEHADGVQGDPAIRSAVARLLDGWHYDAATGDFEGYFAAMTADAVFIGTDASERWEGAEFRAFAEPYFDGPTTFGDGAWTYEPTERWIVAGGVPGVVWFEERLRSPKYGVCRGTGVALRDASDGAWRIAQYALTFPVPNGVAGDVIERIRAYELEQAGR